MVIYHIFIPAGRDEHECGCFICADSSRVDGVSCCYEHGVFMVNGMADENSENREEKALVFAPNTLSLGCSLQ